MDTGDWRRALRREGEALAAAAEAAGSSVAVPSCPDWDVADLLAHVGRIHRGWEQVVAHGAPAFTPAEIPLPDREERLPWYRDGLQRLLRAFEQADAATTVATWAGPRPVASVQRRMAHETAVHRLDAELAAGAPAPLDPALSSDGVDEFLGEFLGAVDRSGTWSVHLHATDVAGEWLVRCRDGELSVSREHAKGDAALRGPAEALLLALWRRVPLDDPRLELLGDRAAAERLVVAPAVPR